MLKWLFGAKEGSAETATRASAGRRIRRQTLDDSLGSIVHIPELKFIGHCVQSPNGRYALLWRDGNDEGTRGGARESGLGRYYLIDGDVVVAEGRVERPNSGHVADNGTFTLNDWRFTSALCGRFLAFRADGSPIIARDFAANIYESGLSPDGRLAVCQACNAPNSEDSSRLVIFDLEAGVETGSCVPESGWAASYEFPTVALDAQLIRYRKTFDLSLGDTLDRAQAELGAAIPGLIADLPGVPGDMLQSVGQRLEAALPEFFAALPQDVRLQIDDTTFRPTVTALQPIYTGGAIPALRRAASANVDLAQAKQQEAVSLEDVNLARAYFGQVLAAEALKIARETRDGFDLHLRNARLLESQGVLSHAQTLQVEVARDAAQRQVNRAELEHDNAVASLARVVDTNDAVVPTTPLFVNRDPVGPAGVFLDQASQRRSFLVGLGVARFVARRRRVVGVRRPPETGLGRVRIGGPQGVLGADQTALEPRQTVVAEGDDQARAAQVVGPIGDVGTVVLQGVVDLFQPRVLFRRQAVLSRFGDDRIRSTPSTRQARRSLIS